MKKDELKIKIKKLISRDGVWSTSRTLGINPVSLFRLTDSVIDDASTASILLFQLYKNGEFNKYCKFTEDGFVVEITFSEIDGIVNWDLFNEYEYEGKILRENVLIFATPFWEDDKIPIEVGYYNITDSDDEVIEEYDSNVLETNHYIKQHPIFKNVEVLKKWFYEKYIPICFNKIKNDIIPELREYAGFD